MPWSIAHSCRPSGSLITATAATTNAPAPRAALHRPALPPPAAAKARNNPPIAVIIRIDPADPRYVNASQPVRIAPSALPAMFAISTAATREPIRLASTSATFWSSGKLAPIAIVGGPTSSAGRAT